MKVYALLTGRGNNTLPDKNVIDVLGKPVLYYPAHAAQQVDLIDEYYVSSDCDKILEKAHDLGYTKIRRPAEFALPTSQHVDSILHALETFSEKPDILIVLLANNITVKSEWIKDCVEIMQKDKGVSAVVPVYEENDHHPYRAKRVNENGSLETFVDLQGNISTNRQDLPTSYFISHNFWVLNVESLLSGKGGQKPWTFMGHNIKPYVVEECIDIHKAEDLERAAKWIEEHCPKGV